MNLKELIDLLKQYPRDRAVPVGFGNPHSYRGYYNELAFERVDHTTVGAMLDCAEGAVGTMYEGYKGGEYTMDAWTTCWLAEYGCTGESLSALLVQFMVGDPPHPEEQ